MNLWEVAEYVGEALVFIGVFGEVYAEWGERHLKRLAATSSITCIAGLAVSFAALIGTNEGFNTIIANLNKQAADANSKAAQLEEDAAGLRKAAEDEHLARVQIEKSLEWRHLSDGGKNVLCTMLPSQKGEEETAVLTYWSDPEPAMYATEFRDAIGSCRPMPGRPDIKQAPALAMEPWKPPLKFGVTLEFPTREAGLAESLAKALVANGTQVTVPLPSERQFPATENRLIVVNPRPSPIIPTDRRENMLRDPAKHSLFTSFLKPFPGQKVEVRTCPGHESEQQMFNLILFGALSGDAGWNVGNINRALLGCGEGVFVMVGPVASQRTKDAANALAKALVAVGLEPLGVAPSVSVATCTGQAGEVCLQPSSADSILIGIQAHP